MRATFFLLVFANLLFFAWSQGYFGETESGREPVRLANQLVPEKVRIIGVGEKVVKPACRLVTGLTVAAADSLKATLLAQGITVDVKAGEDATSYWVHIPPQPNKEGAERKATELKNLGVADFTIVLDEGPNRFALSLGLFKNEVAAIEFLQGLGKRGVKSARIEVREKSQPPRVTVTGPLEILNKRLPEALDKLPETKVVDCP